MELTLKANLREKIGGNLNTLRKSGILPAILYGYQIKKPIPIQLNYNDFEKVYHKTGESALINLELDGKSYNVLIYDAEFDPVTDNFIHTDFYKVRMDQKIEVDVPFEFIGEAEVVKVLGGILVKVLQKVKIRALPKDLPHKINVDVSSLKTFDDMIRVKDLVLTAGAEIIGHNEDDVVTFVSPPISEQELAELEAAPVQADVEAVKVEAEEKKEEREAERETKVKEELGKEIKKEEKKE